MIWTFLKQAKSIDIMLIDTYSSLNFWYAFILSQLSRIYHIPYIPILHGGNLPERLKRNPRFSKLVFAHSYINIAPSAYLSDFFLEKGYSTKIIPNFIDIENYTFKLREKITPKILWVRSFHEIYNPELAILVVAALKQYYPDVQLYMVGGDKDGSLISCKKKVEELKLENTVHFTGLLSRYEWIKLSQDFDIFLNTTSFDNLPVSIVEAMALGLPIVSTNVGGIPYLLDDNRTGLLVPPNSSIDIFEKIKMLLESPELATRLSKNGREKAILFEKNHVLSQWINLLEKDVSLDC